jgi:hypothetical protein
MMIRASVLFPKLQRKTTRRRAVFAGETLGLGGDIEPGALTDHTRACGRAGARSDLRFLRALQMQIIK